MLGKKANDVTLLLHYVYIVSNLVLMKKFFDNFIKIR